jgi:hypothetical protein
MLTRKSSDTNFVQRQTRCYRGDVDGPAPRYPKLHLSIGFELKFGALYQPSLEKGADSSRGRRYERGPVLRHLVGVFVASRQQLNGILSFRSPRLSFSQTNFLQSDQPNLTVRKSAKSVLI